jgi:hypothetical protein
VVVTRLRNLQQWQDLVILYAQLHLPLPHAALSSVSTTNA